MFSLTQYYVLWTFFVKWTCCWLFSCTTNWYIDKWSYITDIEFNVLTLETGDCCGIIHINMCPWPTTTSNEEELFFYKIWSLRFRISRKSRRCFSLVLHTQWYISNWFKYSTTLYCVTHFKKVWNYWIYCPDNYKENTSLRFIHTTVRSVDRL